MSPTDTHQQIRDCLASVLTKKGDQRGFSDQDSLAFSGRLESVEILEVAVFIEKTFGIDFFETGLDQANFDSVDAMAAWVESKRG